MRYYGEDYLNSLTRSINAAYESTDSGNYSMPIRRTYVDYRRRGIQDQSINISQNAFYQFNSVKNKLQLLQDTLNQFYGDVDHTSTKIYRMTDNVQAMIREHCKVLTQLCDLLNGAGDYKGYGITSERIANIEPDEWVLRNKPRFFWTELIDVEIDNGHLNEKAVQRFLESYEDMIASGPMDRFEENEDTELRLKKICEFYKNDRFGKTGDIRDMDVQRLKNCITAFELMNPIAKERCDKFFKVCYAENNETVEDNVLMIKYMLYTAPSKYRDLIIYYMPSIKITDCAYQDGSQHFSPYDNTLCLDLTVSQRMKFTDGKYVFDYPCINFFHEMGHGIDDVTDKGKMSKSSDVLHDGMISDLKSHMTSVLKEAGYSLDKKDKKELFNFIISKENINVVPPEGKSEDYFFPKDWNDTQKEAFDYLRKYYGYREYEYLGYDGFASFDVIHYSENDLTKGDFETIIIDDSVGAITNNQLAGINGHYMDPISSTKDIDSADDIVKKLKKYYYWYDDGIFRGLGDNVESEFFAQSFSYKVAGVDLERTAEVFGGTCDSFNKLIEELYDSKVPEKFRSES